MDQNNIAQQLHVNQPTISQELFRKSRKREYRYKQAQYKPSDYSLAYMDNKDKAYSPRNTDK